MPPCQTNKLFEKFSIRFQGPEFFNALSREIQNSESVGLFGKDLKSSFFLGHIYVVLFVELHTFSFLFFNLLRNHFSLSTCTLNSHGLNYILRKPYSSSAPGFYTVQLQGAKKIIFTACHSGKMKLAFTSPDIILTSPKSFLMSRIDFIVLLLFEFLKKRHLPRRQVKNRIH